MTDGLREDGDPRPVRRRRREGVPEEVDDGADELWAKASNGRRRRIDLHLADRRLEVEDGARRRHEARDIGELFDEAKRAV